MDERKKTIRELKEKRREDLLVVDGLLEELGAALLERIVPAEDSAGEVPGEEEAGLEASDAEAAGPEPEGPRHASQSAGRTDYMPSPPDVTEYHYLLREIDDSEGKIRDIEAGTARLKDIEEAAQRTEQASSGQIRTLSALYTRLGEYVLDDSSLAEFAEPYRTQLDDLVLKVKSLEDRLNILNDKGESGVFSWIGKNAQTVVVRSFLGKNQKNIQKIFAAAGEQFLRSSLRDGDVDAGIAGVLGEIEDMRKALADSNGELVRLREEQRRIDESFGSEGNPQRKIRALERRIADFRERLRAVYIRYGARLEKSASSKRPAAFLIADEKALLDRIGGVRKTIKQYDERIETLEASLAIDEEREGLAKKERAIVEQRQRITAAEGAIGDLMGQIDQAKLRIEELSKKL
jgi:chromosome segregation ATPase